MAEGMLSGHRVLVVEDDYFLASELEQELAAAGAAVLGPVPSVKAALDLLEHETPDAAVLDVNLGGEMVFPVADALAAGGVPFFFVTGYDRAVLPERHAAARWLSKPVETSATVREFRRLLGAAALAQSGRSEGLRRVVCRPSQVRAAPGPLWPGAGLADRPPI